MAQVKIPSEFALQIALLQAIVTQNTALGSDSPLAAFLTEKEIDLTADSLAGNDAVAQENKPCCQ